MPPSTGEGPAVVPFPRQPGLLQGIYQKICSHKHEALQVAHLLLRRRAPSADREDRIKSCCDQLAAWTAGLKLSEGNARFVEDRRNLHRFSVARRGNIVRHAPPQALLPLGCDVTSSRTARGSSWRSAWHGGTSICRFPECSPGAKGAKRRGTRTASSVSGPTRRGETWCTRTARERCATRRSGA